MASTTTILNERLRQLEHWKLAADRLADLDALASAPAWRALEHYVGVALRQALAGSVAKLRAMVSRLENRLRSSPSDDGSKTKEEFLNVRQCFLRTETTLDFYADALATRSQPQMATLLRACDHLATRGMAEALAPLGRQAPAALTYLDKGLGASILKAGIRLWDPTVENPVAAIKAVRHNLLRPTALLHEAGHQVAHALRWNDELAAALKTGLAKDSANVAEMFSGWSSEIAGDAFAFVHTGFAAVVALRDVVAGSDPSVFQFLPGDPHPVAWLRVLMNVEMCRRTYGAGPWDELANLWLTDYPLERAPVETRTRLEAANKVLPKVVEITLFTSFNAFGGRSLAQLIDPQRVSPSSLERLRREAGDAALTSSYWVWNEAIRLLAMTGYRTGLGAREAHEGIHEQQELMNRLGALHQVA